MSQTRKFIRDAWRLWSVKLAALVAVLTTIIAGNQTIALGLVYFLPDGLWRWVVAGGIGIVVFVIPAATRLVKQTKPEQTDGTDTEQN